MALGTFLNAAFFCSSRASLTWFSAALAQPALPSPCLVWALTITRGSAASIRSVAWHPYRWIGALAPVHMDRCPGTRTHGSVPWHPYRWIGALAPVHMDRCPGTRTDGSVPWH